MLELRLGLGLFMPYPWVEQYKLHDPMVTNMFDIESCSRGAITQPKKGYALHLRNCRKKSIDGTGNVLVLAFKPFELARAVSFAPCIKAERRIA
jgi:hypothetical protein